jgi:serine/threonine protein kinase
MPLEPGTKLGAYEILAPLTSGPDRAEAYRASDTRQRRDVVITILPHQLTENAETQGRLERDIQAIASLKHPNISMPYELVRDDPSIAFLVTEWIDGETLAARLTRGPLPIQEALAVAIAVVDALDKAHRQGVIHRGLTPSAVMLTRGGAKLLDFGLTKPPAEFMSGDASGSVATKTAVSGWAGVPASAAAYMAPEQFQEAAVDARTDIFAFGAILHEMVTGRKAFDGKTQALVIAAIQSVDPEPVSKAQPMVPPALDHLLQRCLSKDPRQRLQTAWDLLAQLQWIAGGASQIGIPATVVTNRRR